MMGCNEHEAARGARDSKPVLRTVYGHLFRRILAEMVPGSVLEIGGGAGRFKDYCPQAVITDLVGSPYVDHVADASGTRKCRTNSRVYRFSRTNSSIVASV